MLLSLLTLNITAGRQKLKAKINLNPTYKQNKEKRVASLIDNQPGWCNTYYLTEHKILRAMWCNSSFDKKLSTNFHNVSLNKAGNLEVENVLTVNFFYHYLISCETKSHGLWRRRNRRWLRRWMEWYGWQRKRWNGQYAPSFHVQFDWNLTLLRH